jgi:hypothetical protein
MSDACGFGPVGMQVSVQAALHYAVSTLCHVSPEARQRFGSLGTVNQALRCLEDFPSQVRQITLPHSSTKLLLLLHTQAGSGAAC